MLLTGATGAIGACTLSHLLNRSTTTASRLNKLQPREVSVLVRAQNVAHARHRLKNATVAYLRLDPQLHNKIDDVNVIVGSFHSVEDWISQHKRNLGSTTHVLNLAANTSYTNQLQVAHTNTTDSLKFYQTIDSSLPQLEHFVQVSTGYLFSDSDLALHRSTTTPSPTTVIHESNFPSTNSCRHETQYTLSKAMLELELSKILRSSSKTRRLTIARPSIVIGHSLLGWRPTGSILWAMRAIAALNRTAWPLESKIDIIPVDYVSTQLCNLLYSSDLTHRVYHISAGEKHSSTWADILAAFKLNPVPNPSPPLVFDTFDSLLQSAGRLEDKLQCTRKEAKQIAYALRQYGRFAAQCVVFDNRRLLSEPTAGKFGPPPPFVDYIPHSPCQICQPNFTSVGRR